MNTLNQNPTSPQIKPHPQPVSPRPMSQRNDFSAAPKMTSAHGNGPKKMFGFDPKNFMAIAGLGLFAVIGLAGVFISQRIGDRSTSLTTPDRPSADVVNTADCSLTFNVAPVADLSLVKSVNDPTPTIGNEVIFTVTINNSGPSDATNVTVTDQLPSGYTYVGFDSNRGAYNNVTGVWNIVSLASGASATLNITATVNATGEYVNSAQVTTSNQSDPDSTPGNDEPNEDDQDEVTTTPTAAPTPTPIPESADLSLVKSVDNPSPTIEEEIVFTITVSNAGPNDATNVTVTDQLPSGYTYVSHSGDGSLDLVNQIWTIGTLSAGSTATLNVTVIVNDTGAYDAVNYTNSAQVETTDQEDPDSKPGNNDPTEDDQDQEVTIPLVPTPTPTPVPIYVCGSTCTTDAQCQTDNPGFVCSGAENGGDGVCRLGSNPTHAECQPPVGPMCMSIALNNVTQSATAVTADPILGDTVTLTCGGIANDGSIDHYIFRIIEPNQSIVNLAASTTTPNVSEQYTITQDGAHQAQCQVCTGPDASTCNPYENPNNQKL